MPPASREGPKEQVLEEGPCKDAHEAVDAYKARMAGVQASAGRASEEANKAAAEMSRCMYEPECSSDGRRAEALKKDLSEKEEKAAQASDALGPMEAKLFELNQAKAAACATTSARPGR